VRQPFPARFRAVFEAVFRRLRNVLAVNALQKAVFWVAKDGLLPSKKPSFTA
jgi:hypothetical protein